MASGRELLERIAVAVEKLASDPEIEIESGPPICPTCGKLNPVVEIAESEAARGPLVELMIPCRCTHCGNSMIVVIDSYSMHRNSTTAVPEVEERKAGFTSE